MQFKVNYKLYGCDNSAIFQTYAQYSNFILVMEENFADNFSVREIESIRTEKDE